MNNWKIYTDNTCKIEVKKITSRYIIEEFGSCLTDFFKCKYKSEKTTFIKDRLTGLAIKELVGKPKYKTYSNKISPHLRKENGGQFKNKEWLYDLHWYTESDSEPYMPIALPLIVECEWNPKRNEDSKNSYSGIKYDFQKLLVSNADLRLMIFSVKKESEISELNDYFDRAINSYIHLTKGSKFLFIAFDEKVRRFFYTEKRKI